MKASSQITKTEHVTNVVDYTPEMIQLRAMVRRVFDYLDSRRGRTPTADNIGVRLQLAHGNSSGKFTVLNKHTVGRFIYKDDREDIGVITLNEALCAWEPARIDTYVKGEILIVYMTARGINPVADGGALNKKFFQYGRELGLAPDPENNTSNWIAGTDFVDIFKDIDYSVFDKYVKLTVEKPTKIPNLEAAHARWILELDDCVEHVECKNRRTIMHRAIQELELAESQAVKRVNGKVSLVETA